MSDFPFPSGSSEHLDLILATSEIGVWELDAKTGTAVRNLRHDQIFGHETMLDAWSADIFLSYVYEEDRERVRRALETSIENGTPWSFETRIRRADGVDRWISARGTPKFAESGEVAKLIGHVIDITETKQNEDRLKLLSKELNHRVSNTFAIMNSMVRHASKKTNSVEEFAATLLERLGALARANRVLVAAEAERSSLREILEMELKAFEGWQGRIAVTGNPNIWFSGEASEAIAMILHELLTNAVKHGALSVPGGRVALQIEPGAGRKIVIRWAEQGGPEVVQTRRSGIGSTILQNATRDEGTVTLDYAPEGLVCEITVKHSFEREVPEADVPASTAASAAPTVLVDGSLSGRMVMIVEDDPIIGLDIAEIMRAHGAKVIGPFTTVANALVGLRQSPDIALLDVNLGHETTDDVAAQLSAEEIPFLVLSGQIDSTGLSAAFEGARIISKPFDEPELVTTVLDLARSA